MKIIDVETDEEVGTVTEDGDLTTDDDFLRETAVELVEGGGIEILDPVSLQTDDEDEEAVGYGSFRVAPGEEGFLMALVDHLPFPYDAPDDEYDDLESYAPTDPDADKMAQKAAEVVKEWTGPHEGERGGTFWYNTETDERRYQESKPDEADGSESDDSGGETEAADTYDDDHDIPETDPERDLEALRSNEDLTEHLKAVGETPQEGFTVQRNLESVDAFEEDVYWTGLWAQDFDADEFDAESVASFYEDHRDVLDRNPALHIGGWHYGEDHEKAGKVALDISIGIADKERATEVGKELNQEGIANLAAGDFVDTEGGGASPLETPEDAADYKESNISEDSLRKVHNPRREKSEGVVTRFQGVDSGRVLTANAIAHGANHGMDVAFEEGSPVIDGERFEKVEAADGDDPDDDDFSRAAKEAVRSVLISDDALSKSEYTTADDMLHGAHKNVVQYDGDLKKAPPVWNADEKVPDFVKELVIEAITKGDAVWQDISGYSSRAGDVVRRQLKDNLTQPQGWSLTSLVNDLTDEYPGMDKDKAMNIVRTETGAVMNTAREMAYERRDDVDEQVFYWQGPADHRRTEVCREIVKEVESRGGSVPLDDLREILREKAKKYENTEEGGTPERVDNWIPHYMCRHTLVRDVKSSL